MSAETLFSYLAARLEHIKAEKQAAESKVVALTAELEHVKAQLETANAVTPEKIERNSGGQECNQHDAELNSEESDVNQKRTLEKIAVAAKEVAVGLLQSTSLRLDLSDHGRDLKRYVEAGLINKAKKCLLANPNLLNIRCLSPNEQFGLTLLHMAAAKGKTDMCKVLIEKGIDIYSTDLLGRTALHCAAEEHHPETAELLISYMGDRAKGENAPQDAGGITPAGYSALRGKDKQKKAEMLGLLHEPGDVAISPLVRRSATRGRTPRTKNNNRKSGLSSRMVIERYPPGMEEDEDPILGDSNEVPSIFYGFSSLPGYRVAMEDAITVAFNLGPQKGVSLFGVFDGHGGRSTAEFCSKTIGEVFENTEEISSGAAMIDAEKLISALAKTCEVVDEKLSQLPQFKVRKTLNKKVMQGEPDTYTIEAGDNSGSTAIIAAVTPSFIGLANIGDSRAIIIENDQIVAATTDQRQPTDNEFGENPSLYDWWGAEEARVLNAGGYINDIGRVFYRKEVETTHLAMTRAFGDFLFKQPNAQNGEKPLIAIPEVSLYDRVPQVEQLIVLACDGLWDILSNEQMKDKVVAAVSAIPEAEWKQGSPRVFRMNQICEEIAMSCVDSHDNLSIIIIRVPPPAEENWVDTSGVEVSVQENTAEVVQRNLAVDFDAI